MNCIKYFLGRIIANGSGITEVDPAPCGLEQFREKYIILF